MISINLHASNINGKGKGMTLMFRTFLPLIVKKINKKKSFFFCSKSIKNEIKDYLKGTNYKFFNSVFPSFLYRVLECTYFPPRMNQNIPLLTFGDVPLRYSGKQVLFLANAHLVEDNFKIKNLKFIVMRFLFKINLSFVDKIIVQTNSMKKSLMKRYQIDTNKIVVINSPPPNLILDNRKKFIKNIRNVNSKLNLFYPATFYPHKNHKILTRLKSNSYDKIENLFLTIPTINNPNTYNRIIKCLNNLKPEEVLKYYSEVDALLFLSKKESYGFPLIEAMLLNLHIICPNLEYAREICGNAAIYFEVDSETSLSKAIEKLEKKIEFNISPDWSFQLSKISTNWNDTVKKFLNELN